MNEDLINRHKNDPSWTEVVCLYSGLFDATDEREEFIIDLSRDNVLLAAECKTSSKEEQENLQNTLSNKANSLLNSPQLSESNHLIALFALSELNRFDIISNFVGDVKGERILYTRKLFRKLPATIEAKDVLLTAFYSKPTFYFLVLLESLERFELEEVYLTNDEVNKIFEVIIEIKIKLNQVIIFVKKYHGSIQNIDNYKEYAFHNLSDIGGYDNLIYWIKAFELNIRSETLLKELCYSKHVKALHNAIFVLEKIEQKYQPEILRQMLEDSIELVVTALIYLNLHPTLKKYFELPTYQSNIRINPILIREPSYFQSRYLFIHQEIRKHEIQNSSNNEINKLFAIGDIITCRLITKRLRDYLVRNIHSSSLNNLIKYLIPLKEVPYIIRKEGIDETREFNAKVIYIDISQRRIFLSIKQLDINTEDLRFNPKYLHEINIGDVVTCKIGYRAVNKVFVRIMGLSKTQSAVIFGDSEKFMGVSKVKARVDKIKNQVIYLSVEKVMENTGTRQPVIEYNHTSTILLRENKNLGLVQKILVAINERLKIGEKFLLMDFHSLICNVCKLPLIELFPERLWFINYLEQEGYVEMLEENQSFLLKKLLDIKIFNKINSDLKAQGWSILSSFETIDNETKQKVNYLNNNSTPEREKQLGRKIAKTDVSRRIVMENKGHANQSKALKIKLNDIVNATVTDISFFGIFLGIDGESRKGIIPVTELSNNHKIKISTFEYNGVKLHIGQKLVAKVIEIDDNGIRLSIRQLTIDKK